MKIRTKISLWVGLLLFLIILLTGMGIGYVNTIKKSTDNILVSNHLSIWHAQNILNAVNLNLKNEQAVTNFENHLIALKNKGQEGELKTLVGQLEHNYEELRAHPDNKEVELRIRKNIAMWVQINTDAIIMKSNMASEAAKTAIVRITIFGIICFGVALVLFINLPRSIARPVAKLMEGTQEIARKNYAHRIHIKKGREFKNLAESFNKMSSKLEEYAGISMSKLWIEKKRIETIIDSISEPIIILDENDHVLFINLEALKITDLKLNEVLGANIQHLSQVNRVLQSIIRDGFSTNQAKSGKKELKLHVNGEESYFEAKHLDLAIAAKGNASRKKIGTIILLQNITSYKKLDIAKTNFIASMSHNFKTPIASSQIGLQLLRKDKNGQLSDEQKQLIDSIEEDIQKLLSITSDLLKISEVESGNIQLQISSVDLHDIIDYAVNTIKRQADRKLITLKVDIPDQIAKIKGDAEKIAWVLINLISNAIRYSNENSTVRIHLKNTDKHILLFVEDQGQGIPVEYRERIFARYFRAPDTNEKGTGLGLAISREFMEAQGGAIELDSDVGKGSRFTVIMRKEKPNL